MYISKMSSLVLIEIKNIAKLFRIHLETKLRNSPFPHTDSSSTLITTHTHIYYFNDIRIISNLES